MTHLTRVTEGVTIADFETWLSGSTEDAFKMARSYAAEQMRIVQFGSDREDLLKVA